MKNITKNKDYKYLILLLINIGFFFYLGGFLGIVNAFFLIFMYSILFYIIRSLLKKIRQKDYKIFDFNNFNKFVIYFTRRAFTLIIVLVGILGVFCIYNNEISPAKMPIIHLTNQDKDVVFIGMSHIGTQNFYDAVKEKIIKYKSEGYTLYFEGVKLGSDENNEAFNNALGMQFDENTYKDLSNLYGLVNQDNNYFLGLVNDNDKNVDVSIDEIMNLYNEKNTSSGSTLNQNNLTQNQEVINVSDIANETLSKLNDNQLKLYRYINKAFISMIIKNEGLQSEIQNNFANSDLFDIILNDRNKVVADEIQNSDDKKIIAIYGLLHYDGIFEILKNSDIKWREYNIEHLFSLK